tara:strand:- start:54 stop:644 length:591 start_codon:yes stop_codon:yes gene_type:complete
MLTEGSFYYWGPLLFKAKLINSDIIALTKLCHEAKLKKIDRRQDLVGVIKNEFSVDIKKYTAIIKPYLNLYKTAYRNWYGKKITRLQTDSVWVNLMKKGDYNPPHTHAGCELSSILYLNIPAGLKKENEEFVGIGGGPGAINFFIAGPQAFYNNIYSFLPEVGDFYIFPWSLTHYVGTFRCKGIRTSIAANFKLKG